MALPHSLESALGSVTLDALRGVQRRALDVRVHRHVDRRGRVTPYLEVGTPRRGTLVWLHGFSDRFDTILQAAPHLRRDFRILSPSLPGFGEGWVDPSEEHTFDAYAEWIADVLRDVAPERFHLMGNSLGGATALAVAARIPERVASVVALNAAGVRLHGVRCAHDEIAGGDNLFEIRTRADYARLQGRVFAEPMKLPRWIETHLFDEMRRHADWYIRLGSDLAKSEVHAEGDGWYSYLRLPEVTPPTLVLWGDRDTLFPVSQGEQMARAVANGRLSLLEGVGHSAHLERPKRLAEAFAAWAQQIS